jgi:predicted 3-demethylubiquinone-9 3-methyltransferase (glyoxalase superfamily)
MAATNPTPTSQPKQQKITTFLWFDGNAEEAANFYCSVFKNSRILNIARYGEAGPGPKGTVMVVDFELDGQNLTALNGGPQFKFNEAISLVIHCDTQDEIDYYWEKLTSDGGQESMCGWLKDKYGLSWQVVPSILPELFRNDETGNKVLQAVMQMRKLDLATMKKAAEGRS